MKTALNQSRFLKLIALSAMSTLLLVGCKPDVDLGSVTGKITLDGQPLQNAFVQFVPVKGGRAAVALTDANGEFVMQYSGSQAGTLVGQAKVEITTVTADSEGAREKVPKRYNTASELIVDVEPKANRFEWDLQSK